MDVFEGIFPVRYVNPRARSPEYSAALVVGKDVKFWVIGR